MPKDRLGQHRKPGRVYAREGQCHARWWDGTRVVACQNKAFEPFLRCADHGPDGCEIDASGDPQSSPMGVLH